ncbi:hypothetical protein NC653_002319 [Populus alba x Populus x berolinensis]|uniref:Uncharacterized protein n=2 Tax=Populus TaxID=3689 RepID=A0A4U5N053_POPAL|nr:hypothetical protein NC653_002319 [Populus alba x Populus x berolinensis]TKR75132.1 hypothetical protein D5086_0000288370 [Populus alba]
MSHKQRQELCFTFQTDSSSLSPAPERSRLQLQQRRRLQPCLVSAPAAGPSRLQRKHRQEEKDRDQHQVPAFFVVFRISDDRLCTREAAVPSPSPVSAPGSAEQKRG